MCIHHHHRPLSSFLSLRLKTVIERWREKAEAERKGRSRGVREHRAPGTTARSTPTHDNNVRRHHERYDRARRQGARQPHRSLLNTPCPLFHSGEGVAKKIIFCSRLIRDMGAIKCRKLTLLPPSPLVYRLASSAAWPATNSARRPRSWARATARRCR
jgi:hypothetical protein